MKNEINVGHYRVSVDTTGNEDNMIEKIKALWIKYEEIIASDRRWTNHGRILGSKVLSKLPVI